jgi:hypothetical protein
MKLTLLPYFINTNVVRKLLNLFHSKLTHQLSTIIFNTPTFLKTFFLSPKPVPRIAHTR